MSNAPWHRLAVVTAFGAQAIANPVFFLNSQGNTTIAERSSQSLGLSHFTSITSMAAIGDSYSAGIGAGERLKSPWVGAALNTIGAGIGILGDSFKNNGKLIPTKSSEQS